MVIPPLIIDNNGNSIDRRITTILRNYWEYIKGNAMLASESRIDPEAINEIWENCFIVKADNSCQKEDYLYKYIGKNITNAYGEDLTGLMVNKMASPQAGHLAEEYEKVLATRCPVFDEGEIQSAKNKKVKYRQILLPLGEDGVHIDAILGGMSYKTFD